MAELYRVVTEAGLVPDPEAGPSACLHGGVRGGHGSTYHEERQGRCCVREVAGTQGMGGRPGYIWVRVACRLHRGDCFEQVKG